MRETPAPTVQKLALCRKWTAEKVTPGDVGAENGIKWAEAFPINSNTSPKVPSGLIALAI